MTGASGLARRSRTIPAVAGGLLLTLVLASGSRGQPPSTELPGMTYASLQQMPDWNGWWTLAQGPSTPLLLTSFENIFQPKQRARLAALLAPDANVASTGEYCRPYRFAGDIGGSLEDVEFLLTPGRLTITNESGLLRRIAVDGRPLRDNPEESNGGTSMGHWENQTLIVETIGLRSDGIFPGPIAGGPLLGKGARLTERLRLDDQSQLEVETELVAPEMLLRPLKFKRVYRRDLGHIIRDRDTCSSNDRSIDPKTGLQRFDMTPPADLPPPPSKE
jgi:hypothetical protein